MVRLAGEGLRSVGVEPPSPHPRASALSCPSLAIYGPGNSLVRQPRPAPRFYSQRRTNRYSPQTIARAPTTASAANTQKSIASMHSPLSLAVGYNTIVTHGRRFWTPPLARPFALASLCPDRPRIAAVGTQAGGPHGSVGCSVAERNIESRGGLVKLNDWIDETVELQFVTREENGEPQKISGNLESVGDRGVMLYYDETPRGRLFFYPWHTIERVEIVRD